MTPAPSLPGGHTQTPNLQEEVPLPRKPYPRWRRHHLTSKQRRRGDPEDARGLRPRRREAGTGGRVERCKSGASWCPFPLTHLPSLRPRAQRAPPGEMAAQRGLDTCLRSHSCAPPLSLSFFLYTELFLLERAGGTGDSRSRLPRSSGWTGHGGLRKPLGGAPGFQLLWQVLSPLTLSSNRRRGEAWLSSLPPLPIS